MIFLLVGTWAGIQIACLSVILQAFCPTDTPFLFAFGRVTFREATILTSVRRSPLSAARFQLRHTVHGDLVDTTIVARAADG